MQGWRLCLLFALLTLSAQHHAVHGSPLTSTVEGTVAVPGVPAEPFSFADCKVVLTADSGKRMTAHVRNDGSFRFSDVPAASYLMDVNAMGYIFPQFRVDVSSKRRDQVTVSLLSSLQLLEQPLYIVPLGVAKYYLVRKPMDIKAYAMSPYGLMIGFAVLALVVMPMLKVDPEEMKRMQEEMKDSPFAGLLGGPAPGASTPSNPAVSAAGPSKKKR